MLPAVRQHTLNDFRLVSRYLLDGLVTPFTEMDAAAPAPEQSLSGPVPQDGTPFPIADTAPIQYQPSLYQARASVNWRAMVNDDLGIFRDIANRLAIVANRGISQFLTKFFFSTTGLNTTLFQAGYTNLITTAYGAASNNPPLSQQGLQDAWKVLAGMRDSSNYPILPMGKPYLIYGPAYEATVKNLMSSTRSMIQVEGGTGNAQGFPAQFVEAMNWSTQNMTPIMEPFIPIVISNATWEYQEHRMVPGARPRGAEPARGGVRTGCAASRLRSYSAGCPTRCVWAAAWMRRWAISTRWTTTPRYVSVFGGTVVDGRSCAGSTGAGV